MGLIFDYEPKDSVDIVETLSDLESIVDEMNFRNDHCQTLYPGYHSMSWIELCDEAIEKFVSLKEEDPSYAVKPAGAHWIEEHDDTVDKVIYICSNCGAVFDGLPRSPFCPSCKVLMTGGK